MLIFFIDKSSFFDYCKCFFHRYFQEILLPFYLKIGGFFQLNQSLFIQSNEIHYSIISKSCMYLFLQIPIFLFVLKVKIVLRAFYLKCPIPWTSRSIHSLADLLLNSIFNDSAKNLIFFHDNLRKNFIIAHQIPT